MNNYAKTQAFNNADIVDLQKIKSKNSIKQINKLHNTLITLEEKCNIQIAAKYLTGFLEEKGAKTYKDYINSLS